MGSPLDDLKKLLVDGSITKDIEYEGHTYTFSSLNEEEDVWKDRFVQLDSPLAMATSKRAPTLAIALKKMDGIYVEDLFPDFNNPAILESGRKFLIAQTLLDDYFRKMKREHISALYGLYITEIEKPEKEAIDEIKK
jgi:hypothetical protein